MLHRASYAALRLCLLFGWSLGYNGKIKCRVQVFTTSDSPGLNFIPGMKVYGLHILLTEVICWLGLWPNDGTKGR